MHAKSKTILGTINLERLNLREELILKHKNFITNCEILSIFAIPKYIST
jgi:hypothetical protein